MKALSREQVDEFLKKGAQILDTRYQKNIADGYIRGSLAVPFEGREEHILKDYLVKDRSIVCITEPGREEEIMDLMKEFGYSNVQGYLEGGFDAWKGDIDMIISIDPDEFALDVKHDKSIAIFDLRTPITFKELHVKDSVNKTADDLIREKDALSDSKTYYILSEYGDSAMTVISFLKMNGKHSLYHVGGGFQKVKEVPEMPLIEAKRKKKKS